MTDTSDKLMEEIAATSSRTGSAASTEKTKATLRAPIIPPTCKKSNTGQHEWSANSTPQFCIRCGEVRQ